MSVPSRATASIPGAIVMVVAFLAVVVVLGSAGAPSADDGERDASDLSLTTPTVVPGSPAPSNADPGVAERRPGELIDPDLDPRQPTSPGYRAPLRPGRDDATGDDDAPLYRGDFGGRDGRRPRDQDGGESDLRSNCREICRSNHVDCLRECESRPIGEQDDCNIRCDEDASDCRADCRDSY